MQGYCDNKGRTWEIPVFTIGISNKVKRETGFNLYEAAQSGTDVLALLLEPFTLASVLWVVCESQAKEHGVSEDDFGDLLTSEMLEKLGIDLVESVIDFFPRAKAAAVMKADLRGTLEKMDQALISNWKRKSTEWPASSELTPAT